MDSDRGEEPSLAVETPIDEEKGSALPPIAAKADDLEEIKKAVEDAASVSGGPVALLSLRSLLHRDRGGRRHP